MELVNGYRCETCADVAYAKRNIDPAHPKDGPFGADADANPENVGRGPAFRLGGVLADLDPGAEIRSGREAPDRHTGVTVDVTV